MWMKRPTAKRLEHLKAEKSSFSKSSYLASLVCCAERVGAILNHGELVRPRDAHDRIHVARLAVKMGRYNRASVWSNCALQFCGVHVEGYWIDVHKNRAEPENTSHFRDYPECQCGENNL